MITASVTTKRVILSFNLRKLLGQVAAIRSPTAKITSNQIKSYSTMAAVYKVLVTRPDFPALSLLNNFDIDVWNEDRYMPRAELLKRVVGKHALLVCSADKINDELLDAAGPQLKVISTHTVGYDHVDVNALKRRNICFGNTPGVLDDAVAELTIALLLASSRRIVEGRDAVVQGEWPSYQSFFWMNGMGLKDSVVGIIGLGRIGMEIARRLVPFKVKEIIYTSRQIKPEAEEFKGRKVELEELLKESDVVIVMCVLCDDTRNLISDAQFNMMKRTAIIVNTSRGGVLDQDALVRALKGGIIHGAALDVTTPEPLPPDHELLSLKNCCVIPHLGSAVVATRMDMAELTARNLVAGLTGQQMPAQVI